MPVQTTRILSLSLYLSLEEPPPPPHRGVMANVLDCDLELREFELLSRYYDKFWTNTPRKGINLFICPQLN